MTASPEDAKNMSFTQDLSIGALFSVTGKNCVVRNASSANSVSRAALTTADNNNY